VVTFRLRNPFVLSAAVVAALIYCGSLKLSPSQPFMSFIRESDLTGVEGSVCSNPVMISSGKYYSVKLRAFSCSGYCGGSSVTGSASGILTVFLPDEYVENLYPGKLYSDCDSGGVLAEAGEILFVTGRFSDSRRVFYAAEVFAHGHENSFAGHVKHFRALCRLNFRRLMYSWGKAGGLVLSLLSGSRDFLEDGIAEAFMLAGLSHVLALSGMHLSFFSGIAGFTGKLILGKRFSFFSGTAGTVLFIWFAGFSPSLFRAFLCFLILAACNFSSCREPDMFCILCCAFLIHVCVFPEDVYSAAFILSYGALAGILLFSDFCRKPFMAFAGEKLSSSLGASAAAQSATAPLSFLLFKTFSPAGIAASVIVSPLISFFMTFSLFSVVLSLAVPFLSSWFGIIMNGLYYGIVLIVKFFAIIPCVRL